MVLRAFVWHGSPWLALYCVNISRSGEMKNSSFSPKAFYFADSQSLSCEVDSSVSTPVIFSFLPTRHKPEFLLWIKTGRTRGNFCLCLFLPTLLLAPRPVLCSAGSAAVFCAQEHGACCIWAESGWNCYGN